MPALTDISPDMVRVIYPDSVNPLAEVNEAATQTFGPMTLLTMSSGGLANASIATGSNYVASGEKIVGLACHKATGVTGKAITVTPANRIRLVLPCYHATPASATNTQARVGVSYELRRDATYGLMVDVSATGSPTVKVTAIPTTYPGGANPVAAQYGYVEVEFLASVCHFS